MKAPESWAGHVSSGAGELAGLPFLYGTAWKEGQTAELVVKAVRRRRTAAGGVEGERGRDWVVVSDLNLSLNLLNKVQLKLFFRGPCDSSYLPQVTLHDVEILKILT